MRELTEIEKMRMKEWEEMMKEYEERKKEYARIARIKEKEYLEKSKEDLKTRKSKNGCDTEYYS